MLSFENVHVLIVEDDNSSVEVLIDLCRRLKVSYTILFDSRKVVETLEKLNKVDAIFLDLEMPQSNGYEVLAAIKEYEQFSTIPVVAYTSHSSEMSNARSAGFHSFLGKPIRGSDFPEHLTHILNNQNVWAIR